MKQTKGSSVATTNWNPVRHLTLRSLGLESCHNFRDRANGSKNFVQRLVLAQQLKYHDGCVNTLHFNPAGDLIASGSDDLNIAIWNWAAYADSPKIQYDSGHSSNVFQAKFMPHSNDMTLVSCARDGQVRVGFLSLTNKVQHTKRVAQHRGAAHKLCIEPGSPHLLMTCGEDAVVYNIDLREQKPNKLFCLQNEKKKKVALYSIHINPMNDFEFAVGGRDQYARIFDRRKVCQETTHGLLKKLCPDHLKEVNEYHANITCLVYNYSGTELLTSYNDEDIYLFDTTQSPNSDFIHRYKGHRNCATVKGVNFFGPRSEYVVSGSDCSHIFFWQKDTEDIVQFLSGDETGVVNVLEPHPHCAFLATSGLDHDIKIWTPTGEKMTGLDGLEKQIKENNKEREDERQRTPDPFGEHLLFLMFREFSRRQRRQSSREARRSRNDATGTDSSECEEERDDDGISEHDEDDEDGSEPESATGVQCHQS